MKSKCIVVTTCLFLLTNEISAQVISDTLKKNNYTIDANALRIKAKSQNTGAWLMLSAGAIMATAGLAIATENASNELATAFATVLTLGLADVEQPPRKRGGGFLAIAGTTSMVASIPLFRASAKNKWKAKTMN